MPPKSHAGGPPRSAASQVKAVRTPQSGGAGSKAGLPASKGSATKGGAAKGGATKGSLSPAVRSPMPGSPAEKRLLQAEKLKAKEEEAKKAAEEAEKAQKEAVLRAKEQKRERLANSHAEQIQHRREQELQMQHQRNALRAAENARKRLAREEKEKGAAWPYKMRLHAAAMNGDLEVAEVFLREDTDDAFNVSRIDPNIKWREDGQSPIFVATVRGQLDMIKRLIAAKADVNITNNDGRTPLSLGAEFGRTPAMSILVDAGADINARDNRGRTALHVAVTFNRVETTRQLLIWKVIREKCSRTHARPRPPHLPHTRRSPNKKVSWVRCWLRGTE